MADATTEQNAPGTTPATAASSAMSPAEIAEAKRYNRLELYCGLADRFIDVTYLAVMAFVAAKPLDTLLMETGITNDWARLAALFSVVFLLHECVSLPLSFYSGFVLERQFGLGRLTLGKWLLRHYKRLGLTFVFSLLLVLGLFAVIWTTGNWWWLVAAGLFFLVSVVAGQLLPVLILPLFYKIEPLERPDLQERLERLSQGTGLTVSGVFRMGLSEETAKANAMLAGLGRTRRVLLGDTLVDAYTPEEIDVVFAHELGHHVHRHIPKMLFIGAGYSLISFWLCDRVLAAWIGADTYDPRRLPVFALPLISLFLTCLSMILEPAQNALSRHFERQCDRYALRRTGNKSAYRAMFEKLARQNKDDPDPHPLEVVLFHGHPPIRERIALADE